MSGPSKVLVTGANGFVAAAVVPRLAREPGVTLRLASRGATRGTSLLGAEDAECVQVGDLDEHTEWKGALEGVDVIVHLSARVHQVNDRARDPQAEFRRVNVAGTEALARSAVAAGVRRMVFLSTVKVHGESGAFTERDAPRPADDYAHSKHEAELALRAVASGGALEVVVIRPPLVHGPGARANLASLVRAIRRGVPLPLGAIDNRRSLVGVGNLADLIATCVSHADAPRGDATYLVSDGEDVSTPELVRRLAAAMGRPARLVAVPPALLRAAGTLTGKRAAVERLLGSLTMDIGHARRTLGWAPPHTLDDGLRRAVEGLR